MLNQLPLELANEPFSTDYDNGLRAEILVPRRRFLFEIRPGGELRAIVGTHIHSGKIRASYLPVSKSYSNVSVLTVYDTYGLRVADLFLGHLLKLASTHYELVKILVKIYLLGCCTSLDLDDDSHQSVEHIVQSISTELIRREKNQLVSSEPITWMPLPIELCTVIINSLRVSKELAKSVRGLRALEQPTVEDLQGWSTTLPRSLVNRYIYFQVYRGCDADRAIAIYLDRLEEISFGSNAIKNLDSLVLLSQDCGIEVRMELGLVDQLRSMIGACRELIKSARFRAQIRSELPYR